jgi:putative transposase
MTIRRELIDELLKEYPTPQDVLAEDGLLKQVTKAVIEHSGFRHFSRQRP